MDPDVITQVTETNKAMLRCLTHLADALPEHLRPDYQFLLKRAQSQQETLATLLDREPGNLYLGTGTA